MKMAHIRSFVSQRGHITQRQKIALDTLSAQWCIPFKEELLDLPQVFGRSAPTVFEIGFGMGETTLKIAQSRPETNFLCLEVFPSGVGSLLQKIADHQVTNIRIMQYDAVMVLQHMIAQRSLAGVHTYFPDPWPKKRHHKRRLIQPAFVELISQKLAPEGYLHCATDWENYAEQMLEVLSQADSLQNAFPPTYAPRPDWRPITKFENRGLRLGHGVWDLIFHQRSE